MAVTDVADILRQVYPQNTVTMGLHMALRTRPLFGSAVPGNDRIRIGPSPPPVLFTQCMVLIPLLCLLLCALGCARRLNVSDELQRAVETPETFLFDSIAIKYQDRGSGNPIVLLHGFGGSSYSWRYVAESFSRKYRVISIDLKGFGLSDKPEDGRYSALDQSRIISGFIEEKGLKGITLVGHSYGGAVALLTFLSFEANHKNPIKELILIDAAAYRQPLPAFISIMRTPCLGNLFLSLLPGNFNARVVLKEAFFNDGKISEEMVRTYASYLGQPGAHHALIETARQIIPRNVEELSQMYSKIGVPVLLIWGEEDRIVPTWVGERLARDLPQGTLIKVPKCGHIPQEECPVETIQTIHFFLESGTPRPDSRYIPCRSAMD